MFTNEAPSEDAAQPRGASDRHPAGLQRQLSAFSMNYNLFHHNVGSYLDLISPAHSQTPLSGSPALRGGSTLAWTDVTSCFFYGFEERRGWAGLGTEARAGSPSDLTSCCEAAAAAAVAWMLAVQSVFVVHPSTSASRPGADRSPTQKLIDDRRLSTNMERVFCRGQQ